MLTVTLLGAEKVEIQRIAVFGQPHRRLVEQRSPLERGPVQPLALLAVAVLGVDRIAVVLEHHYHPHQSPQHQR